jgi:hypothetical protein
MPGGDAMNHRSEELRSPGTRRGIAAIRARARRVVSLLVGAVLALTAGLGAGGATAYWTTTGTGFGAATTATPKAVTLIAASGTVDSTLFPGGTADLLVALDNPNSYPVTITGISQQSGSPVVAVGSSGTCTVTGVSVPSRPTLSITVGSGENVVVHIPAGAAMSAASDSGCQGATFRIPVTVTVRS